MATVGDYLIERGVFDAVGAIEAAALGGGVSNVVLAARQRGRRVVVKQALERLRVADEWLANPERVITEGDALRLAERLVPGSVPEVLDLDPDAFVLTIAQAPAGWATWKDRLLAGNADPAVAARLGELLATWHTQTFEDREVRRMFGGVGTFEELRVEPYYRTVARRRPDLSAAVEAYVERMQATRLCLVHGDYSPKNVLLGSGLWVIDFEVAHYGDPAFDLAFMLNHLLLKRLHVPDASVQLGLCTEAFWSAYEGQSTQLVPSITYVLGHVGCLMVARVDGKSPAEYLTTAEREAARDIGSRLLFDPPRSIAAAIALTHPDRVKPPGMTRSRAAPTIAELRAREVLDSRGRPTVEVDLELSDASVGRASVPSGASTGSHEAHELRDGETTRFGGFGVRRAVANVVETIAPAVIGRDPSDQGGLDATLVELDGTSDRSRLGANAMLAVSVAAARAGAVSRGVPLWRHLLGGRTPLLPLPMVNIVSGGLHALGSLSFQDFLIVPIGAATFSEALETVYAVRECTRELLTDRGLSDLKADEGGFGPPLDYPEAALELLEAAIVRAGRRLGEDVALALDVAATHFFDGRLYRLSSEPAPLTPHEFRERLERLVDAYPIVSIEDGLAEDDWEGWAALTRRLGARIQLVGDDLFTTNLRRLERGITAGVANAVLVKMNQIGTLTETIEVIECARTAGYATVVSARSGETEDSFLADLAVATCAGQIKIGSLAQSERLSKYNQLLRIEEALGPGARFAGAGALSRDHRVPKD